MRRGLTRGEGLLIFGAVLLGCLIAAPIFLRARLRDREGSDVEQMRRVYVAISMYQEDNFGRMPGSLLDLQGTADMADLVSPYDPASGGPPWPVEPALPDRERVAKQRVSYPYVGNFVRLGLLKAVGPTQALLANPWQGEVKGSQVSGKILRIRQDGSLATVSLSTPKPLSDPTALFGK